MSILKDFKDFAIKGNVIDLAVAVIIGGAFGKIVSSMVEDMIMPVIGAIIGKLDFSNLYIVLGTLPEGVPDTLENLKKLKIPVLAYGRFLTVSVDFMILAFIIFLMVRLITRLKKQDEPIEATPVEVPTSEEVLLLREIRDQLKKSS
ncbi:large conductance mechanosensitive channel protein MscL [Ferrovum sp. PN-J185]|uniref:large conductance mechanosensitive channel protein MscL n=1 Tax=Ferrovum sp. PN-J185 TaxID=1356306 RepID=UPI001E3817C7|nr:large conductance mechanosensitive channel protein MscL [Ferrovum sp. PN-J185]MCC6068796.1 large conductance mechanosensitive channel protein MscL [Ferrovum sp. PN-J185]MDE1891092.1 large conductance mechanosensitive channel protein MscL [Betaproteobacteria bacterium]